MTKPRIARPAERWRTEGGKEIEVIGWSPQACGMDRPYNDGHGAGKCRLVSADNGALYCSKALGETGELIDWPGRCWRGFRDER